MFHPGADTAQYHPICLLLETSEREGEKHLELQLILQEFLTEAGKAKEFGFFTFTDTTYMD